MLQGRRQHSARSLPGTVASCPVTGAIGAAAWSWDEGVAGDPVDTVPWQLAMEALREAHLSTPSPQGTRRPGAPFVTFLRVQYYVEDGRVMR